MHQVLYHLGANITPASPFPSNLAKNKSEQIKGYAISLIMSFSICTQRIDSPHVGCVDCTKLRYWFSSNCEHVDLKFLIKFFSPTFFYPAILPTCPNTQKGGEKKPYRNKFLVYFRTSISFQSLSRKNLFFPPTSWFSFFSPSFCSRWTEIEILVSLYEKK